MRTTHVSARWSVARRDDNGGLVIIASYPTRSQALAVARQLNDSDASNRTFTDPNQTGYLRYNVYSDDEIVDLAHPPT